MSSWKKELPMWITLSRMGFVIPIVALMIPGELKYNLIAAALFILASITDYYDGYFARKYQAVSNMGKFMDPIADKVLITSILVMLVQTMKIDPLMVIIILARDTLIGGLRSVAAADQIVIDAKPVGKWKTALQMVAIPSIMIDQLVAGVPFQSIGYYTLWISVVLSVISGFQYYFGFLKARKKA